MAYIGYIYRHWIINSDSIEKTYIGQMRRRDGKVKLEKRWGTNGKGYAPKNGDEPTKFYDAIQKYGWNNFKHDILLKVECSTYEELAFWLDEWEKYYIEKYDSYYNGYNSTTGGSNGIICEESRIKMSDSHKWQKGENNPRAKKVICLNTLEIFPTAKQAGEKYGVSSVKGACNKNKNGIPSTYGKNNNGERLWWAWYEEYEKGNYIYDDKFHDMKRVTSSKCRKIICITTGEIFASSRHAQNCTGKSTITNNIKDDIILVIDELEFMFYDDYIKNIDVIETLNRYNPQNAKHSHKQVVCLNTNSIFKSCKDASEWCKGDVSRCCKGKLKTAGKHPETGERLRWMYYEDFKNIKEENGYE